MNGKTTLMNAEIYEALIAANVPNDKAKAAAESVVRYDDRLNAIDTRLTRIETTMRFHSLGFVTLFAGIGGLYWRFHETSLVLGDIASKLP